MAIIAAISAVSVVFIWSKTQRAAVLPVGYVTNSDLGKP